MRGDATVRSLVAIEAATGIGIILFWIGFFTVGLAPSDPPLGYFTFEHAFPIPDTMLAMTLLTAAVCVRDPDPGHRELGRLLSLAAAGALIFLGLLDASFNAQHGIYTLSVFDGVLAAVINSWCVGAGLAVILLCRRLA